MLRANKLINREKSCCSSLSDPYFILLVNILSQRLRHCILRQCHCISLLYFISLCDELYVTN